MLNDARAYDVGLSDDAGGGNPLGFASKVRSAPLQDEVTHLDDYIKWTLWGIKTDTAKPPYRSLQVGGDPDYPCDHNSTTISEALSCYGIRMTMFYYSDSQSPNNSGHFDWNYTEVAKCALPFGGPTWCMTENMAGHCFACLLLSKHGWSLFHVSSAV